MQCMSEACGRPVEVRVCPIRPHAAEPGEPDQLPIDESDVL